MQTLSNRINKPTVGRVFVRMPGLLYPPGFDHAPQQIPCSGDAGGDLSLPREPWPGARAGCRAPEPDETGVMETALSEDEVIVRIRDGAFLARGDWQ